LAWYKLLFCIPTMWMILGPVIWSMFILYLVLIDQRSLQQRTISKYDVCDLYLCVLVDGDFCCRYNDFYIFLQYFNCICLHCVYYSKTNRI